MSQPHAILSDIGSAYSSGHAIVEDPGDGGTLELAGKSGCICTIRSVGTRTLPVKATGWEVLIIAAASCEIVNASGSSVAVMDAGDSQVLRSVGGGRWQGPPSATLHGVVDARTIGVVMNDPSASIVNSDILNEWAEGTATTSNRMLYLPSGDIYISDNPWTFDGVQPPGVVGPGAGADIFGSSDVRASAVARLIGVGLDNVVVFQNGAGFCLFSGFHIYGYMAATRAGIKAGSAGYADACILIKAGSGGINGGLLQLNAAVDGIVCGEAFDDQQTDTTNYQLLIGNNLSNSIMKIVSQQSANHRLGMFHQFGCPVGIHAVNSCDINIDEWYIGSDGATNDIALKVDYANINAAGCSVSTLHFDGSEPNGIIMQMSVNSNASYAHMNIGFLRGCNNAAYKATLRGAGNLVIKGGINIPNNIFRGYAVTDGSTFNPSMTVRDATLLEGATANALGDTTNASQGVSYVLTDGLKSYTGSGGPSARLMQTWTNGTPS